MRETQSFRLFNLWNLFIVIFLLESMRLSKAGDLYQGEAVRTIWGLRARIGAPALSTLGDKPNGPW